MCMETAVHIIVLGFAVGALISLVDPLFFMFMFSVLIYCIMITLFILLVLCIFVGVKTMIDIFSCKHNESNVNNDNEHDDYVEDDTDLSMMLFQKKN